MPRSFIVTAPAASGVVDATTVYFPLVGSDGAYTSTEANAEQPVRVAGRFRYMSVTVETNTASTTTTVTLRKSRADTTLIVSVTADGTGIFENTTDEAEFAATDEANYEITVPTEAGTNTFTPSVFGVTFLPDDASLTWTPLSSSTVAGINFSSASVQRFIRNVGGINFATIEAGVGNKFRIRYPGTLTDMGVFVSANARTTATDIAVRVNGVNGNQGVSFGSTETGWKEPNQADAVVAGDDVNFILASSTGTNTITFHHFFLAYRNTSGRFPLLVGDLGLTQNFNVTNNSKVGGDTNVETTESNAYYRVPVTTRFTELSTNVAGSNTIATSPSTIRFRVNGADGNNNLSVGAGATGIFSDSSNTDFVSSGTPINYRMVTPNTSGALTWAWIAIWGKVVTDRPPYFPGNRFQLQKRYH